MEAAEWGARRRLEEIVTERASHAAAERVAARHAPVPGRSGSQRFQASFMCPGTATPSISTWSGGCPRIAARDRPSAGRSRAAPEKASTSPDHLSGGEWALAEQLYGEKAGDRYAVLLVRRTRDGGVPKAMDVLVDPLSLGVTGHLHGEVDGYKTSCRTGG